MPASTRTSRDRWPSSPGRHRGSARRCRARWRGGAHRGPGRHRRGRGQGGSRRLGAGPPGRVSGVALDVTDAEAVAAARRAHRARTTGISTSCSTTPGSRSAGRCSELTLAHWNRTIDVNLRGVVHGVVAAYPIMIRQGHGHIVNTASLAGLLPPPCSPPYGMTKHGVVGLSESLRMEAAGPRRAGERGLPRGDRHATARQGQSPRPPRRSPTPPTPGRCSPR